MRALSMLKAQDSFPILEETSHLKKVLFAQSLFLRPLEHFNGGLTI